ncbi:MAG: enoyl-CoA hydratase-related protein [Dethiobacteria bacterium]|jgi:enoyl-CoA hydratase/carnithine racemase|nr:enoyl-CoA hydratase-related protein [Bacillota bacterium]
MSAVTFNKKGRIGYITLNRPEKLNTVNRQLAEELLDNLQEFERDDTLWVCIITGAGERSFSAGADLTDAVYIANPGEWESQYVRGLTSVTKPMIAAVNGYCLGIGLTIALTCDLRIAAENAYFGTPDQKLNTVDCYASLALASIIPKALAMEILFTGEMINATEAYRVGLVNKVVPLNNLISEANLFAEKILQNGPLALRACKKLVNRSRALSLEDGLLLFESLAAGVLASEDTREGITAFLEKRPPRWKGR